MPLSRGSGCSFALHASHAYVTGAANSLWQPLQQSDGSWEFRNSGSGLCLDVTGAGSNQGQQLDQWPCKNAPGTNQDFNPA